MLTRFSIDMDGSMEPDEAGWWVRYEDAVKLREPAQQGPVPRRVAECLAVLRPTVKGKFPQEPALDELVGHLTSPKVQQPAPVQDTSCKFPMCQTEEYQQMLAAQVARDLFGTDRPRKAVKLTDEEIEALWTGDEWGHFVFARAIEDAVLKANGVSE